MVGLEEDIAVAMVGDAHHNLISCYRGTVPDYEHHVKRSNLGRMPVRDAALP